MLTSGASINSTEFYYKYIILRHNIDCIWHTTVCGNQLQAPDMLEKGMNSSNHL